MYIPVLMVLVVSALRPSNAFGPLPLISARRFVDAVPKQTTTVPVSVPRRTGNANANSKTLGVLSSTSTGANSSQRTIPITLLSGFLGAGKTCALKNLLENKDDLKIGVIVNDVAAINIDAKLLAGQAGDLVELQNGCVCCSLSNELIFAVEKLITGRELDSIVIELTGIADPKAIRQRWAADLMETMPATIENVVTVIDSTTFGTDYMTWDLAAERRGWVAPGDSSCSDNHKISELLAEQVEAANVIVINKVDIADREQVEVATKVARALNGKATVVQAEFGKIPTKLMMKQTRQPSIECHDNSPQNSHGHHDDHDSSHQHSHDHASSEIDAGHRHDAHSHSHSHLDDTGITNFVYTATAPFDIDRLMKLLSQWPVPIKDELDAAMLEDGDSTEYEGEEDTPFTGVIRSKGFCWFAPRKWSGSNSDAWRHDSVMYWSHAGRQFGISQAGKWWATLPDEKMKSYMASHPAEYHRIKSVDFKTTEFGDRRQEIVFIGTDLRIDEITLALNSCLVSARELDAYRQRLEKYKMSLSPATA